MGRQDHGCKGIGSYEAKGTDAQEGSSSPWVEVPRLALSSGEGSNISLADAWRWYRGTHLWGCWEKIAVQ